MVLADNPHYCRSSYIVQHSKLPLHSIKKNLFILDLIFNASTFQNVNGICITIALPLYWIVSALYICLYKQQIKKGEIGSIWDEQGEYLKNPREHLPDEITKFVYFYLKRNLSDIHHWYVLNVFASYFVLHFGKLFIPSKNVSVKFLLANNSRVQR